MNEDNLNAWDILYDEGKRPMSTTYTQTNHLIRETSSQVIADIQPEELNDMFDVDGDTLNYTLCFVLFWSLIWVFITISIKWNNPTWVVFSILSWYVLLYFAVQ